MRDTLNPGELAFQYGASLQPNSTTSVSAQIITTMEAGAYKSVKFQVTFEIDPAQVVPYNHPNKPPQPGNYQVNYNEIGFAENKELIFKGVTLNQLYVSMQGARPFLNMSVPLGDGIKRDSGTDIAAKRPKKGKSKTAKK